ncbi:MAG: twin-arginine translocase TatA/TatE family subunit [Cellulomonadaceae bacterium]|nr:twin-arginine translocase TatA/TatE family subunit [Cellulomonadaceae bacterium]
MRNFGPQEMLIVLLVVLLLFGARRLPDLARSVGKSMKIFREEVKDIRSTDGSAAGGPAQPGEPVNGAAPLDTTTTTTTDDNGERRP